jgi:hypothetical protein
MKIESLNQAGQHGFSFNLRHDGADAKARPASERQLSPLELQSPLR